MIFTVIFITFSKAQGALMMLSGSSVEKLWELEIGEGLSARFLVSDLALESFYSVQRQI